MVYTSIYIEPFKNHKEINRGSLHYNAFLEAYISDLKIAQNLADPYLRWVDMMCNTGRALNEFTSRCKDYDYVLGVEPSFNGLPEYNNIIRGDPATLIVTPRPNLITSRYGFIYLSLEEKIRNLKAWFSLLEGGGEIVIWPYANNMKKEENELESLIQSFRRHEIIKTGEELGIKIFK